MLETPFRKTPMSLEKLHKAAVVAAELVARFGDDYWPVFERIDHELEARRDRKSRLSKFVDVCDQRRVHEVDRQDWHSLET